MALAIKGYRHDLEMIDKRIESILAVIVDAINNNAYVIAKSMGARMSKPKSVSSQLVRPQMNSENSEPLPLNLVLQQLGGKGVAIEYKKNG